MAPPLSRAPHSIGARRPPGRASSQQLLIVVAAGLFPTHRSCSFARTGEDRQENGPGHLPSPGQPHLLDLSRFTEDSTRTIRIMQFGQTIGNLVHDFLQMQEL